MKKILVTLVLCASGLANAETGQGLNNQNLFKAKETTIFFLSHSLNVPKNSIIVTKAVRINPVSVLISATVKGDFCEVSLYEYPQCIRHGWQVEWTSCRQKKE